MPVPAPQTSREIFMSGMRLATGWFTEAKAHARKMQATHRKQYPETPAPWLIEGLRDYLIKKDGRTATIGRTFMTAAAIGTGAGVLAAAMATLPVLVAASPLYVMPWLAGILIVNGSLLAMSPLLGAGLSAVAGTGIGLGKLGLAAVKRKSAERKLAARRKAAPPAPETAGRVRKLSPLTASFGKALGPRRKARPMRKAKPVPQSRRNPG